MLLALLAWDLLAVHVTKVVVFEIIASQEFVFLTGFGEKRQQSFFKVDDGETDALQFSDVPEFSVAGRHVDVEAAYIAGLDEATFGPDMLEHVFYVLPPNAGVIEGEDWRDYLQGVCKLEVRFGVSISTGMSNRARP